jgi:membrane protease YdiL (CAAX protease family)
MPQPEADPLQVAFVLALLVASVMAWGYLVSKLFRAGRILAYEPRRPVPWGWPAAVLAVLFVLTALLAAASASPPEPPSVIPNPLQAAERILGIMLLEVIVTGAALALVVAFSSPNMADLGLPPYVDGFLRDVRSGIVAWLAALAPVFGLLLVVRYMLHQSEEPSHHPLVDTVIRDPYFGVMLLATLAVVVVAPICEEIIFRLLLQGWLEKWEDARLGWREDKSNDEAPMTNDEARMTNDECRMTNEEQSPPDDSSFVIRHSSFSASDQPPRRGLAGLPYGWLPILVSSLLFALAHIGYGPEPVPLFVLALILGYVYQRTHRIVPCIVTHALFNLIAVIMLWRLVSLSPE